MRLMTYRNYLLLILTIICAFNIVDRLVLGIVLQDIKLELQLTDTELGFLGGIAFALFYSVLGIPIARWADRGNRVFIILVTTALWSVAVALCGAVRSFTQLLLIRVAIAVGEAGCIPPAMSLLADYFNRAERPWATALYSMSGPIACIFGFFVAGWLNALYGWRMTFILLGLPGLLLTVVVWLTLKEPRNSAAESNDVPVQSTPATHSLREVMTTLWPQRTFRHLLGCIVINAFFGYGLLQWWPAFLARSYGLSNVQIGTGLAITIGLGAAMGTCLGGMFASRRAVGDETLQLRTVAIAILTGSIFLIGAHVAPNVAWVFVLMGLFQIGLQACNGPVLGTIQSLVPERMRAVSFALIYLFANLIGMGLGPLVTGAMSDALRPWAREESLRYALLILSPGYFWSAWHVWRASRTVRVELAGVSAHDGGEAASAEEAVESRMFAQPAARVSNPAG